MNLTEEARRLLTCDELRGRVPEEVQAFLRDVAALEPHAHELRAWGIFQRIVRRDDVAQEHLEKYRGYGDANPQSIPLYTLDPRHDPE